MAAIWKNGVRKVELNFWAKLVNFQVFQLFENTAKLLEAIVSKPLKTKGYQWKDIVHLSHLIPCSTPFDNLFGDREAHKTGPLLYKNLLLQKIDEFPYGGIHKWRLQK